MLKNPKQVRPWSWADTYAVGRLTAANHVDLILLAGASGRSLALGPGHLDGTPLSGRPGNSVLSAYRDTHFTFMRDIHLGDILQVQTPKSEFGRYRVQAAWVMDQDDLSVLENKGVDQLTLITRYAFNALRPGGAGAMCSVRNDRPRQ